MRVRSPARRPVAPEPLPAGQVALVGRDLSVIRGERALVDRVSLDVTESEVVALVGPNGAGKSTLLGVLAGDIAPDGGEVALLGRPLEDWSATDRALRRAVLAQQSSVSFPFTVREVVLMGRAPWVALDGDPDGDDVVDAALARLEVAHLAGRRVPTLSGGEQARVALARTVAQDAPVLLLDEPTAALDLRHQELVLGLARSEADEGRAVVVVLHDLALAAAHADRIVVLQHGRVVVDGPPAEVLRPDLLGEVYQHPVEVIEHPRTGALLVLPRRDGPLEAGP